jgi:hypothetical protein
LRPRCNPSELDDRIALSHDDQVETPPSTPVEAWRQLIGIVGLRKSNIFFVAFALAVVALLFYEGRAPVGLLLLVFATIHATRVDTLLAFLLGDWIRRRRNVAR